MKSKISFFSPTIYRKNMSRFWPIWGITVFFSAMIPLGKLVSIINYKQTLDEDLNFLSIRDLFLSSTDYVSGILMFMYALIVSMAVWSYMYSAKSISLMHSIPVTRTALYITNVLSGLTMLIAPVLVYGILYELIGIYFGNGDVCAMLTFMSVTIGLSIIMFSIGTLSAHITGNILALPFLYVGVNTLAAGVEYLIEVFASGYIYGYSGNYAGVAEFLSPFIKISNTLQYVSSTTKTSNLLGAGCVYIYTLVSIALLVVCCFIYTKRKSESAGDTISVSWLKPVFTSIVSGIVAIPLAELLYFLLGFSSIYYNKLVMSVLVVISGIVGYYASIMLLNKTFAVFKKKLLPGLIATSSALIIICFITSFDVFNAEEFVPDIDEITAVTVSYDNTMITLDTPDTFELATNLHKYFIEDKEASLNTYKVATNSHYICGIKYYLKDGRMISRSYPCMLGVPDFKADFPSSDALKDFMSNQYLMLKEAKNITKNGEITYISTWGNIVRGYGLDATLELQEVYEAFIKDLEEGNYRYDLTSFDDAIFIEFETTDASASYFPSYSYHKFILSDTMVNTLEVFKRYGWDPSDEENLTEPYEYVYSE